MAARQNRIIYRFLLLGCIVLLGACSDQKKAGTAGQESIPTYRIKASYGINVDDPKALVASADYSFVGIVKRETGTSYQNLIPLEQADGTTKKMGEAYTHYTVQVLANLKNKLVTERSIKVTKQGGIREDHSAYDVLAGDSLLKTDQAYVFNAYAQADGTLLVSGKNSTVPIKDKPVDAIADSSVVKTYQAAVGTLSAKELEAKQKASDDAQNSQ